MANQVHRTYTEQRSEQRAIADFEVQTSRGEREFYNLAHQGMFHPTYEQWKHLKRRSVILTLDPTNPYVVTSVEFLADTWV